jgi:hypothetical protein
LDKIGFDWDPYATDWEEGFAYLKGFNKREGHCRVPAKYKDKNGFRLGQWVRVQRVRMNKMASGRRKRLDAIGFIWDPFQTDWEEGFGYLKIYKKREGHCRVPQGYAENGFRLGVWVAHQRRIKSKLSKERRQRLNGLGFIWTIR